MVVPRASFLALVALAASGCIFAEPPERTPLQTPPILDLAKAVPAPTDIVRIGPNESRAFSIPFRSEDAGEPVWWTLHQNYSLGPRTVQPLLGRLPASTLSDTTRKIEHTWQPSPLSERCFQVSFVVCHEGSFDVSTLACTDPEDTALATWWVNFGDVAANPSLEECPSSTGNTGTAQ